MVEFVCAIIIDSILGYVSEATMQKWQYLRFYLALDHFFLDNVRYERRPEDTLVAILNRLGLQGWELVNRREEEFLFKKPLEI